MQWDAEKYTTDFSFVAQYGSGVLDLLEPDKHGTVLDLGCGTGALSGALLNRGYTVIGAGSVVTQSIPPNVVAVGVPCKVLRKISENDKATYPRYKELHF